jgi:hypothetical protein
MPSTEYIRISDVWVVFTSNIRFRFCSRNVEMRHNICGKHRLVSSFTHHRRWFQFLLHNSCVFPETDLDVETKKISMSQLGIEPHSCNQSLCSLKLWVNYWRVWWYSLVYRHTHTHTRLSGIAMGYAMMNKFIPSIYECAKQFFFYIIQRLNICSCVHQCKTFAFQI